MDRREAMDRARELVTQMTVEEAAAQLRFDSPAIERLNIPEYNWWNEGLHGVARAGTATSFPQAIALAATFHPDLVRRVADAISTEGRAKYNESRKRGDRDIYKGLTYWSPNVNIFRDPRWGRGHETYGEDPFLTGTIGAAFIKGLQGEGDGVPYLKLAACAKHYAVHSGPEGLRHEFNAEVGPKDLWETYLPAFEMCVREGRVEAVMGAYNRVNGEPCCAHTLLMEEILRGKWAFEGHFVSDCWAIRDIHEHHHVTKTMEESAALALKRGCDLNCGCSYQRIMQAYALGQVEESDIRRAAERLFTTRYMLGMFEPTPYDRIRYETVECREHLALARQAAEESVVLLKNDGILPLDPGHKRTIGVIGPNANNRDSLIGNYYGTSSRYITVLEGIQNIAGDSCRVLYSQGGHLHMDQTDNLAKPFNLLAEAATVAEHSDILILCLGLDEHLEGEEGDEGNQYSSGDKPGLEIPASQRALLQTAVESGKPFILCMLAGSAVDMNLASDKASAILQAWYPGARGGQCVADILFGLAAPSGKLPVTLYRDLTDMPLFTDYTMVNRTYRHLSREPLYPFGYGLTYGKAEMRRVACDQADYDAACQNGAVIEAVVANPSDNPVSEVAQVYVRVKGSPTEVRNHRLCGFQRMRLDPGEERLVRIPVPSQSFFTVGEDGNLRRDGTGAVLYVGFGQPDSRTALLTGQSSLAAEL